MNGSHTTTASTSGANGYDAAPPPRSATKPMPPASPAAAPPPAPAAAPPPPPTNANNHAQVNHNHAHPHPPNGTANHHTNNHAPNHNHAHPPGKAKKKGEPSPVDPAMMYESLKNRIAALEEEEVHEEEEERRFAEEAQSAVKGMSESAVHSKYIELFAELKRLERDHAKEKQKLTKDKDAAKSQLSKSNATKTKMENLARELQKDNKKLREDTKRLAQSVEDAQDEIMQMKNEVAKRIEKAKAQDTKYREAPDVVLKVVCRYRAELFFRISRKTKLSRLFNAWTDRMETGSLGPPGSATETAGVGGGGKAKASTVAVNGPKAHASAVRVAMQFIFTHSGRVIEAEQTPEEAGIEDGDELLAIEMLDLTDAGTAEDADERTRPQVEKLQKEWTQEPEEAKRTLEELFNGVVRERLKDVLKQYELRERHFECVIRSKELEVLLSRARAAEQKQLAEGEKTRADQLDEEIQQLRKDLDESQNGQTMLIDKLIHCCKEPNAEKTQRLFASLREELEKRGISSSDGFAGT